MRGPEALKPGRAKGTETPGDPSPGASQGSPTLGVALLGRLRGRTARRRCQGRGRRRTDPVAGGAVGQPASLNSHPTGVIQGRTLSPLAPPRKRIWRMDPIQSWDPSGMRPLTQRPGSAGTWWHLPTCPPKSSASALSSEKRGPRPQGTLATARRATRLCTRPRDRRTPAPLARVCRRGATVTLRSTRAGSQRRPLAR